MTGEFIQGTDDLLAVLDAVVDGDDAARWTTFFADRTKPYPFFVDLPDESLVDWFGRGTIRPGRVLELGCGNGRNATYLARQGYQVDAIDISATAIDWARERAAEHGVGVEFRCCSLFDAAIADGAYDLVYDSGCFHHLAPHRRRDYLDLITRALRPGGTFGMACFRPEGGSGYTDREVYQRASLGGGLGYTEEQLRTLWDAQPLHVREIRQMRSTDDGEFGRDFLWALLADKQE